MGTHIVVDAVCLCNKSISDIGLMLDIVNKFARRYDNPVIVAGVDTTDKSRRWRQEVSGAYKHNRQESEWGFFSGEKKLRSRLKDAGIHVVEPINTDDAYVYEADDLIASYAHQYAALSESNHSIILTRDKDLAIVHAEDKRVATYYSTPTGFEKADEYIQQRFHIPTSQLAHYLALVGDSADGWPGLKGFGAVSYKRCFVEKVKEPPQIDEVTLTKWVNIVSPNNTIQMYLFPD